MSQITTHILDTALGLPAANVPVELARRIGSIQTDKNSWTTIARGVTNSDGRIADLLPTDQILPAATYRMQFDTSHYMQKTGQALFYPWVDVVFAVDGIGTHYHIPVLLSPYGYSTYRGS